MSKPQRIWKEKRGNVQNGWHPAHPTLYLKKEVYDKIGLYNLKYKIVSDYDFMIRMLLDKQIKLEYIDEYIVYMRVGGASTDGINGYKKNLKESHQVLVENKIKYPYLVDFYRIMKTLRQMVISKLLSKKIVKKLIDL